MIEVIIAGVVGLTIGTFLGIFIAALMTAAHDREED